MNIKGKFFPEDGNEFPWDKNALETFRRNIHENHIKCRMDDTFLLGFLRARKFDQKKALQLLQNYYFQRNENPKYFNNLLPSKLEHALSHKCMQFLPMPDQKGRYIFILQIANWDPAVSSVTDFYRTMLLYFDFMLNFHGAQENGMVFIMNADGMTLEQLFAFTPRVFASIVTVVFRNSYPLCFKEIHYVNLNAIMKALLSHIIPFLPKEMKEMIYFHNNMTTLHKFFPQQYLPAEFGGELPNFDPSEANQMIRENEEFFRMNEEYLKLYKEANEKNFKEERFQNLDEDYEEEQYKQILQKIETKFQQLLENSKAYLANIDQDSEFDITRLHENKYFSTKTLL